ncbi:hypothetical protein GJAV_G00024540 [Gymnothorax javanicus]|nr:hypothetical protein GJAV_G00024540 [Gymnothorax javanicus]
MDVCVHYRSNERNVHDLVDVAEKALETFPCRVSPPFTPWFPSRRDESLPLKPRKSPPSISVEDQKRIQFYLWCSEPLPSTRSDHEIERLKEFSTADVKQPCFRRRAVSEIADFKAVEEVAFGDGKVRRSWSVGSLGSVFSVQIQPFSGHFQKVMERFGLHALQRAKWVIGEPNCVASNLEHYSFQHYIYARESDAPTCLNTQHQTLNMPAKRGLFSRLVPCRCLRGEEEVVTALDYSHCSLEQVPKEIYSFERTLEELCLDANQIEELPKQLFGCHMLRRLSLPDNDLATIPPAVGNLISLKELDVSKNSIQEFPENIKNCKALTTVEASVNPISKLPDGFTQLISLTQLYLNDAYLEFLPASFGRLTKLQILEMRENQLKVLPKSMHKLTQLERLDLGSNEFAEMPEVVPQLTGMKELWMDGNRLTSLPGTIGALKQLSYFDVNVLPQLPASIGSLKKLTTLKVDENQLMYLPDSIGGLAVLEELDCSFNEMEALPPSIGQCANLRTFAADHNFLTQLPAEIGKLKAVTILFLHSNKLENLPEEIGDIERLKVINLSNNKLKNLPFSFTKLSQLTAMWLSDNQSKPLIPLQKEEDLETSKTVLTNYMFPQQPRTDEYIQVSDNESFNPALWEETRRMRTQVAFECDEDTDDPAPPHNVDRKKNSTALAALTPPQEVLPVQPVCLSAEGHLKRYPTPYPEDLRNMVKTAQTVAHRVKEESSGDENDRDPKPPVGIQDVGVKVIENATANAETVEVDPTAAINSTEVPSPSEPEDTLAVQNVETTPTNPSNGTTGSQDQAPTDSEVLTKEEMKLAEMRPPLIDDSTCQPKVVTLNKDKTDEGKDADSLLDETAANSNQNNSSCSSPSHMSDTVSMTTDSSPDVSAGSPEKEAKTLVAPQNRLEDENQNQLEEQQPLLQNGTGPDASLQPVGNAQQMYESQTEKKSDLEVTREERLALIEQGMELSNGVDDPDSRWDQVNMNVSQPVLDNGVELSRIGDNIDDYSSDALQETLTTDGKGDGPSQEHLLNGNETQAVVEHVNGHADQIPKFEVVPRTKVDVATSGDLPLSQKAEELFAQRRRTSNPAVKLQRGTSTETSGVKICGVDASVGSSVGGVAVTSEQGQGVIRSNSASLLDNYSVQAHPESSTACPDLIPTSKAPVRYDTSTERVSIPANMPPPQYNVQYTSSAVPADNLWAQRTPVPPDPVYPPPHHSLANTNYSNRNHAQHYVQPPHPRGAPRPGDPWGKDRYLHAAPPRGGPVRRQSSSSSTASVTYQDPRRLHEGEYMTYWELQAMGRGAPPQMTSRGQRPVSARTYSMDCSRPPRPHCPRPSPHELPERTMSVGEFGYQRPSPRRWASGPRGKSEDSALDGPTNDRPRDKVPYANGQMCLRGRPQMPCGQMPLVRHPSREQLIDYLMHKVSQQHPGQPSAPHEVIQKEVRVKIEKNPELGFSVSGGGRGNPFCPEDNGIFVTRVQPEGPASKFLQPGDKIVQANGYSFLNIDHSQAVSLLKKFPNTVELIILRQIPA